MLKHNTEEIPFLQELFRENPYLSVNQAAKACDKFHMPIHKNVIAQIRRKVREVAGLDKPALELVHSVPAKEKYTISKPEFVGELPVRKDVPVIPKEPEVKEETKQEKLTRKRKYVDDLVMEHPEYTTRRINDETKKVFGEGVDPMYLVGVLNTARELHGKGPVHPGRPAKEKPALPPPVAPAPTPVVTVKPVLKPPEKPMPAPVHTLPAVAQMRIIYWQDEKQEDHFEMVRIEDVQAHVLKLLGRGVSEKVIEVWKKTSFKIKLDIEVD